MSKKNSGLEVAQRGLSEDMISVTTDFPFYHQGSTMNAKGYLVDAVDMPNRKDGTPWQALVFVATQATEGLSRDGEVIEIAEGDTFGIPVNAALKPLVAVARNPHTVEIVELFHKGKINLAGGKTFNQYGIGRGKTSYPRTIAALEHAPRPMELAPQSDLAALPASSN